MDGSVLVVASKEGQEQVITTGLGHFTMQLELHRSYLLSFEHPGCTTKQLMFNTDVPVGSSGGRGFFFPFQVTLEPASKSGGMEYAGPVGYIRYDMGVHGFAYSTDYRILKDEELEKRVDQARAAWMQRKVTSVADGIAPHVGPPATNGSALRHQEDVNPGIGAGDAVAATVPLVAPLVHVLAKDESERPVMEAARPNPSTDKIAPRQAHLPEHAPIDAAMPAVLPAEKGLPDNVVRREVWADRLHVFTAVSVRDDNRIDEFRRVASYYGGVSFFRNGLPCTEHTYRQGTGDHQ